MTLKRYKRTYGGLPEMVNSGEEQAARTITTAINNFTSTASRALYQEAGRLMLREAKKEAQQYDPTKGEPELRDGGQASDAYNAIVTKAYSNEVYNQSLINLEQIAEEHRNDPKGYVAEKEVFRNQLINESGELGGLATQVFDGISSRFESGIRKGVVTKSVEAAELSEGITFDNTENEILQNIASDNFKPVRAERLLSEHSTNVNNSLLLNDLQKLQRLTKFQQRVFLASNKQILRTFLDSDDIVGANKFISDIRNRQKDLSDGKLSDIYKKSGLTPNSVADVLDTTLKEYASDVAEQIKIENDLETIEENSVQEANEKAIDFLVNLGTDITIADVEAQKPYLKPEEYQNLKKIASGNKSIVLQQNENPGLINALEIQLKDAVVTNDDEEILTVRNEVRNLYINGLITPTRYKTFNSIDSDYRYGPGNSLFQATREGMKTIAPQFLVSLQRAELEFDNWKSRNPNATPELATAEATRILNSNPQIQQYIEAVNKQQGSN